ncbi:MAG: Tetratricopeptide 1 repeat-containing protein [Bacteroidetes bacterium]|jgi:CHAT domain-containing protein/Tfp pilus assembly protein PilF|nr:Tetratricopeptide 1 repeat-containing protein [Bacteroidota bacterium]
MKYLIFLSALVISTTICAQGAITDSITTALKNAKHDTIRCRILNAMIKLETDTAVALRYTSQVLQLCEKAAKAKMTKEELIRYRKHLATAFTTMADQYDNKNNNEKTIEYLQKGLSIWETVGDTQNVLSTLNSMGNTFAFIGDKQKALENYLKGLALSEGTTYKEQRAHSLFKAGEIYYLGGDLTKAVEYYKMSLDLRQELGDKKGMARVYNNIGILHSGQGDKQEALACYLKSIELKEAVGDKKGVAHTFNSIGILYADKGDLSLSLEYCLKALKMQEEIGDKQAIGTSLVGVGFAYFNLDDKPKAFEYYKRALKIRQEIGYKQGIAEVLNNMGRIFSTSGDREKGLEYYKQSLKLHQESNYKQGIGLALNNIGAQYMELGDQTQALNYYTESQKIWDVLGHKYGKSLALHNIGIVYDRQGNYRQALDHYHESLKIREEIANKTGIASSCNAIGHTHVEMKNYGEGKKWFLRGLDVAQLAGSQNEIKGAAQALVKVCTVLEQPDSASVCLALLKKSLDKDLATNYFSLSEKEKENYYAAMENSYGLYYEFMADHIQLFPGLRDTAYNIALRNKGMALKSSAAMRQSITRSGDSILIHRYESWISLKKSIAKLYESGKDIKGFESKADSLEKELIRTSQLFGDVDKVRNLSWQQVQAGLKKGEAAIEFIQYKNTLDTAKTTSYIALLIKRDSKHPEVVRLCTESELQRILGSFRGNNISFVNEVYGTGQQTQTALYNKVWQPLEGQLAGIKTVYYSPVGLLHKVSFAGLSKKTGEYLCTTYKLNQLGSTGTLAHPSDGLFDGKELIMLMGGVQYNSDSTKTEVWSYLPGTLIETQHIASILEEKDIKAKYFSREAASESNFKQYANNSGIVHISTHGFFYPDRELIKQEPKAENTEKLKFRGEAHYAELSFVKNKNPLMRSGLVLAGANDVWNRHAMTDGEDGVLTAQEVSTLDLQKTKLVVLSACETGLGDIKGSEGVFGLQRSFKMAGARYVIMSMWQVPDKETSEFMELFYINLLKLKEIRASFAAARKTMLGKYDPYYWAAFVLME